jgi:hypothetical protein
MKKDIIFIGAFLALTACCYYMTCYINPVLGLFAIGVEVHILDKLLEGLK